MTESDDAKKRMEALYGENRKIEDGGYDESCAVKCVNGTFVGNRTVGSTTPSAAVAIGVS